MEDLWKIVDSSPQLQRFTPDSDARQKTPRGWLLSGIFRSILVNSVVMHSVQKEATQNYIAQAVRDRRERVEQSNNLLMTIRPEFAKALETSTVLEVRSLF